MHLVGVPKKLKWNTTYKKYFIINYYKNYYYNSLLLYIKSAIFTFITPSLSCKRTSDVNKYLGYNTSNNFNNTTVIIKVSYSF